ncbi:MAG: LamG domain-containing protein, partial [Colwellia sp.]
GAQITVTAHDSSHADVTVSSDTALTVSTSPSVDSIVNSPTTISSGSSSTTFYLQQSAALSDIDIDVTDGTYTDSDDGGTEDYVFNFLDTAFRFYVGGVHTDTTPIGVQVAGDISSTQNFSLKAIRTNTDTGECEAALQGVTTSVDMAYECNNPTSCTGSNLLDITGASSAKSVTRNNNGATVSYTGVSLAFDANGVAPFTFKYDDAGQVTLHAKKVVSANSPNPAFTLTGSSNAFWTRPDKLVVSAKSGATNLNGDTAGTTNLDGITATQTHRAGENFDLTVSAYNSLGVVTPNYSPGQIQFKLERTGPTTHGVEGTLTYGSGGNIASELGSKPPSFKNVTLDSTVTPGVFGSVAAQYSEVGLLNLDVQDSNYGNASIIIPAAAINIGRFIPDHFKQTVAEDGYFEATCSTGTTFAYSGQKDEATDNIGAISYLTNPVLAITAYNKQNQITQNYYQDSQGSVNDYMKLSNANVSVTLPIVDQVAIGVDSNKLSLTAYMDMGTLSQNDLTTVVPADNPLAKGVLHYQLSDNDHFVYNRSANALVAPFTSDIDFSTAAITDTDGVNVITTVDASPTGVEIRFGRLLLENSFGPETSNFPQPMQIEHFDGASFVVSPNNDCVSYDASKISLTNISLDPALTSVLGGTGNFVAGKTRAIELKALEAGNQGQMGVSYGTHNWLKYDWDNDGDDDDPSATATFGLYRGNDRIIYWREVYN